MKQKWQRGEASALALQGRMYVVRVYSLLAAAALGVFGSLHAASSQTALGVWELAGAVVILMNVTWMRPAYVRRSIVIYLSTVLLFLGVMLVTGGTQQTGILWYFTFPVVVFFLTDTREGLWWMAALISMTTVIWLLAAHDVLTIAYDNVIVRQLLVSILAVAGGIYAYQRSREQLQMESSESRHELRMEQLRADVIVRDMGEGLVVTDAAGRVVSMSRTAEKLLGWTLPELSGKIFVQEVPMLDEAGNRVADEDRPLLQALRTGHSSTTTAVYRRKNGRKVPISVTSTPLKVDGKTVGVASTFRDVSEEQGVLRAKSEFTTLASHQLRTPLSAIAWTSELLLNGDAGKLSAEQHKYVSDIYQSNQRMAALVSEMLLVSSLELGALPIKPQAVDLSAMAGRIVHEQSAEHADKKLRVTERYADNLPELAYDPDVMGVLLRTLLSNAFKYTPAGGHVSIDIRLQTAGKWLQLEVRDTGYGIPALDAGNIFGKFFRSANIMDKDTDGSGLGLYIVKTLLDYVGGRISFTSQEGKGTTFTVLLPLSGMSARQPHAKTNLNWEGVGNV